MQKHIAEGPPEGVLATMDADETGRFSSTFPEEARYIVAYSPNSKGRGELLNPSIAKTNVIVIR
jgi:hypothetical protein